MYAMYIAVRWSQMHQFDVKVVYLLTMFYRIRIMTYSVLSGMLISAIPHYTIVLGHSGYI